MSPNQLTIARSVTTLANGVSALADAWQSNDTHAVSILLGVIAQTAIAGETAAIAEMQSARIASIFNSSQKRNCSQSLALQA